MSAQHSDAFTLARALAATFANEAPWSDRVEDFDSDDAAAQVADALDPTFEQVQEALLAELEPILNTDLFRKVSDFLGRSEAHSQDGGYLLGLAIGQLIRLPALAPKAGGAR